MAGNDQASSYALGSWVFLRLLGVIYLVTFTSLALQIRGLAGAQGILPAAGYLASQERLGRRRLVYVPTLCWICCTDRFLQLLSWGGAVLSLMLAADVAPQFCLVLLWAFYLSLFSVCRLFLSYQWDVLLLETGFLAIFLWPAEFVPRFPAATAPPRLIIWLFWWLLFRLMFSSGLVKLRSGDFSWRKLTALCHHYQTQPLPTPLAWFAHQLPLPFHKLSAVLVLTVELAIPILIFAPPPARYIAAWAFVILMLLIQATGNYCFFNLLGIALSFLLVDDRGWAWIFTGFHGAPLRFHSSPPAPLVEWLGRGFGIILLVLSIEPVLRLFRYEFKWPKPMRAFRWLSPFHLVSSYGLFAVMTTERPEIVVEGSRDGETWLAYEFKWKPGNPKRAPAFVAPHQPRLDWQMWFAALGCYENHPWFARFQSRLLEGSPPVISLLKNNPFKGEPPRYIRAVVFDYRFTNLADRRATGAWWERQRRGLYSPVLVAKHPAEKR